MKDKLIIIGASGHGKVVADIAKEMSKWKSIVFLDDDKSIKASMGYEVIGETDDALIYKDDAVFFVGIGNNKIREKIQLKLETAGIEIATLIHPNAIIGSEVVIGEGSVVMAGVVVNCSTYIGKGCIINTGSSLDHDNYLSDYVHISPGVRCAGTVRIEKHTWIGIGSIVSNNVNICSHCIIGAGTLVIQDIVEPGVYVGTPAYKL